MNNLFIPDNLFEEEITRSYKDKLREYDAEADLLDAVQEWCYEEGYLPIRINDSMHRGYSDLFIVVQGKLVVAELKASNGRPSKHQLDFIEQVEAYGGIGGVCKTIAEVEDLCDAARYY